MTDVQPAFSTLLTPDREARGRPHPDTAGGPPLFLVHGGTGSAEPVASLARQLPGAATVLALAGSGPAEPRLRTVEGMAARLVQRILALQPEGPYRIAGWSLGGIVAYEAAGLLLGRDRPVEFLGVIHPRDPASPDAPGPGEELVLRAARRYVPPPLPLTVHLFTDEAEGGAGPWEAWGAAEPKAALRRVPLPAEGAALAEALAGELRRAGEAKAAPPPERLSPVFPLRFKGSRAPVYCIPGAGASVVSLTELAASLDPGWPVYGLEPRGMDGTSVPHTAVAAAADDYLEKIGRTAGAGPIHLVGHSFGGWVALEMALRLHAEGRPAASLSLIDSSVPDADDALIREFDGDEAFLRLVEVMELAAERSLEIDPEEARALGEEAKLRLLHGRMVRFGLLPSRSTPAALAGSFRVFSTCLRTTWRPAAPYPRPARLVLLRDPRLGPEANQRLVAEAARGWRSWLPHAQLSVGPGNHMTALRRPQVEQLASLLPLEA